MKSAEQARRPASGAIPQPGDRIGGKYRVQRYLGHGGMGVVMRATHEQLGKTVALKVLRPGRATDDEAVKRFMREARVVGSIDSEHIARIIDLGTHDGLPFMVLELLSGKGLDAILQQRGPLPVEEAVGYLLQACVGVAEAHAHGVVHRDLKPSNLFLTERPDGRKVVKVLDFGVSKITGLGASSNEELTETNAAIGSPYYMSPEQLRSSKSVDARSDIWALGIILFKLLTARLPFEAPNIGAYLGMIVASPAAPLRRYVPDAPSQLEALILRCLEKPVGRRYQTVAELAEALAAFGGARGQVYAKRVHDALASTPSSEHPPPISDPPPAPATRPVADSVPPPRATEPMGPDPLPETTEDTVPQARPTIRMTAAERRAFDEERPAPTSSPPSVPPSIPPSYPPSSDVSASVPPPSSIPPSAAGPNRHFSDPPPWEQAEQNQGAKVARWLIAGAAVVLLGLAAAGYLVMDKRRQAERAREAKPTATPTTEARAEATGSAVVPSSLPSAAEEDEDAILQREIEPRD